MRSIDKAAGPECLQQLEGETNWSLITTECKHQLANACFIEQNKLCIYCERDLESVDLQNNVHCEHLIPREARERVFDYRNISLSCNGTPPIASPDAHAYSGYDRSCGKARDDQQWDPSKYIHLVDESDADLRFKWNLISHQLEPSDESDSTATAMIDLVNVNNE